MGHKQVVSLVKVPATVCLALAVASFAASASGASPLRGANRSPQRMLIPTVMSQRLIAYVAAQQSREAAAGKTSKNNIYGKVISEKSAPILEGHAYFAVAAFSFDPLGHPVTVLSYVNGKWKQVARLAAPHEPGTINRPDALYLYSQGTAISAAVVAGQSVPDFLIKVAGGGCFNGSIVSQVGTRDVWHYVPFEGPSPKSDRVGGNPRFVSNTVVTDNNCTATPPAPGQRYHWTWTYKSTSASLVGVRHLGWVT